MTDTSLVTTELDVLSKYNALVTESLGGDSVYIRAKETLQDLFQSNDLTSTDKAAAIGTTIGNMVNTVTSSSMATALEWAKYEKELALKKLELDHQLAILGHEEALKEAQVEQVKAQNRLALVESRRMYGTGTFDVATGTLLSLSDDGKVWKDMQLTGKQTENAAVEQQLLNSKINESKVAIHKVVADTYVNYGAFTFEYASGSNGLSLVTRETAGDEVGFTTLSDTQKTIAIEQGKGYTYNAWANALTGSASMLGTAIASDYFQFGVDDDGNDTPGKVLLETVLNCAENLNKASSASSTAIPES